MGYLCLFLYQPKAQGKLAADSKTNLCLQISVQTLFLLPHGCVPHGNKDYYITPCILYPHSLEINHKCLFQDSQTFIFLNCDVQILITVRFSCNSWDDIKSESGPLFAVLPWLQDCFHLTLQSNNKTKQNLLRTIRTSSCSIEQLPYYHMKGKRLGHRRNSGGSFEIQSTQEEGNWVNHFIFSLIVFFFSFLKFFKTGFLRSFWFLSWN